MTQRTGVVIKLHTPKTRFERQFPWWKARQNPHAQPKHFLISRQSDLSGLITLSIHTAGEQDIWCIPMYDLLNDHRLREQIEKKDLNYLEWMAREDVGVATQYWTSTDLRRILRGKMRKKFLKEIS